jgi:hypothetical protein
MDLEPSRAGIAFGAQPVDHTVTVAELAAYNPQLMRPGCAASTQGGLQAATARKGRGTGAQTELACPATTVTTSCVVPANLLWQHFEWGAVGAAFGVAVALLVIAIDGARGSRLRTHPGLPVGN